MTDVGAELPEATRAGVHETLGAVASRPNRTRHAISIHLTTASGQPREWTLAGPRLAVAALALMIAIGAAGYLAMRNAALSNVEREADRIAVRNRELEQTAQQLAALQHELEQMHRVDAEIRALLGLGAAAVHESDPAGGDPRASAISSEGARAANSDETTAGTGWLRALTPDERAIIDAPDPKARVLADESARVARRAGFAWPIDGWISSEFGDARAGDEPHNGLDIAAPAGAPVLAAASGEIVVAGIDSLYGRVVVIDHGDDLRSVYAHNASLAVKRGDRVERGQKIATVGSTGQSTAPHLHFEVRRGREMLDPRDVLPPGREAIAGNR